MTDARRILMVSGKGGVGKTTVSAALAVAAARAGKRVCIAEVNGLWRLQAAAGHTRRSYEPVAVAPGVHAASLSPRDCMVDFGQRKLKITALARWIFESRPMTAFVEAIPGLPDMLQLGKLENMLLEPADGDPVFDLVVLDAPATGHGLTMLTTARSMREVTRVGPFHDLAWSIERLLLDRDRTRFVLVSLPEELPVNEALELLDALRDEGVGLAGAVVNQVPAVTLPESLPWTRLRPLLAQAAPEAAGWVAVAQAVGDHLETRRTRAQVALDSLTEGLDERALALPVFTLSDQGTGVLGPTSWEGMAERLATFPFDASEAR